MTPAAPQAPDAHAPAPQAPDVHAPDAHAGSGIPAGILSRSAPGAALDHLVVACDHLAQGVAWCEALFGVTPEAGGKHPLMGTHNRLLHIGSPNFPQAYLELIAIDPTGGAPAAGRARWFGLDDADLRREVLRSPRLVHWVARTPSIHAAHAALRALGEDPGDPVAASRETAHGRLAWQITLRADGRPQHAGALPALIEWAGPHPCDHLPDRGVRLRSFAVASPQAQAWPRVADALGLNGVRPGGPADAALVVELQGLRGVVALHGGLARPATAPSVSPNGV